MMVSYVYIMMLDDPCVDIFTSYDSIVCLTYDVGLSMVRHNRAIVLYVYILTFVSPCADIFTSFDSVIYLQYDVCLSLCRRIYIV
jgi:hypothetical protein